MPASVGTRRALLGSSVGGLPLGALGVWSMDQYQATPRPVVPNSMSLAAVSQNLFSASRRMFGTTTTHWTVAGGLTITDNGLASIDGTNNASALVFGSADQFMAPNIASLSSGTYTMSLDIGTTDASSVSVRMGPNGSEVTKSITGTMSRFSVTFTWGGGNPNLHLIRTLNTTTPANLKIDNATLHAGSVDLGPDNLVGHIMLGASVQTLLPTASGGVLDFSNSSMGIAQFPISKTYTAFTAIAIGSRVAASGGQVQAFIDKAGSTGYTQFSGAFDPAIFVGGAIPINLTGGLWTSVRTNEYHALTNRYDGAIANLFMEDIKAATGTGSSLTFSAGDFWISQIAGAGIYAKYKIASIALWNRALSDAEVRQAVAVLTVRAAKSSITVAPETRILIAEGDSITFGTGATDSLGSYAHRFGVNSSPIVNGVVNGVPGAVLGAPGDSSAVNSLYGRKAADLATIPPNKNGRQFVLSILIGHNDIVGYSGGVSQYVTNVVAYAAAMKAGGVDKIVLCTILPSTAAGLNAARATFNSTINGGGWAAGNGVDGIVNFDSVSGMGADGDASNAANYGDGTHPTSAGYILLEPAYRTVINGL